MQQLLTLIVMLLSSPAWAAEGSSDSGFLSRIAAAAEAVVSYVKGVFDSIKKAVEWLSKMFVEVFKAAWDMMTDTFVWLLESLFKLVAELLNGLADGFGLEALKTYVVNLWGQVPADVIAVAQAIGLPSAFAIIVTGILIRMALQLIPFVRLGS